MQILIILFIGIIILLAISGFIINLITGGNNSFSYPYQKKKYLLSKAEKSFFGVLQTIFKDHEYYICPKVRLADFISVNKGTKKRYSFLNRITSKHVDFLICDYKYLSPKLIIELDDKSHQSEKVIKADKFKNETFKSADIKFIRVEVSKSYNIEELKEIILSILNN